MDTKPVDLEAVERRFDKVDDSDSTGEWMEAAAEALDDVEPLVAEVRRLREALAGLVKINAEDFPRGADGKVDWSAYPVTFGYAQAYRAALVALGEEVLP